MRPARHSPIGVQRSQRVSLVGGPPLPLFLEVRILKDLRAGFSELFKTQGLREGDFGQKQAKRGIALELRILKGLGARGRI